MARCGCANGTTCNCVVKQGANVTVIGNGSSSSPYVISATAGSTTVAPLDTATIDTTVTGGPAYVVSSSVIISPDAGNTLVAHANGLYVPDIDTVFTNGPGISPIVGGVVQVCLSANVGNTISFDGSGCLFAAASAVDCLAVAACFTTLDTTTVNLSPSGVFPLTADVIISPNAGNTLTNPGNGLFVPASTPCISTDANNSLTTGSDAPCLYVPAVALTVTDTASVDLTLTGVGTVASPWNISAVALGSTTVAPLDTATIDTTVTGGPAYVVSSSVIISPDAGNTLVAHGNGLYVADIETPITVTPLDTATFDSVITGADPNFVVSGNVKISTTAGNILTSDATGLYVADLDVVPTVAPLDTVTIDTTVTGGPAYIVSSDVIISPDVGNTLVTHPNGLFVPAAAVSCAAVAACFTTLDTTSVNLSPSGTLPLTADVIRDPEAGNILTIGAAGLDVNLNTGCGLSGDGTLASPLIVDTNAAVWPFACAESNGAPVYCDPVTGGLHVDPQQDRRVLEADLTSVAGSVEVNTIGVPIGGPVTAFGPTLSGTFTNPNPCRSMVVIVNGGVKHLNMRADTSGRLQFQYGLQLTLTGPAAGVYSPNGSHVQFMADGNRAVTDPNWDFIWDTVATTQIAQFILPAGASFNYTLAGLGQLTNYNGDGQVNTLMVFAHFDGQTL